MSDYFRTVRDQGVLVTCEGERHHQQVLYLPDAPRAEAERVAGFLDGTCEWFIVNPRKREIAGSTLARCQIPGCGAWVKAEVFGYD